MTNEELTIGIKNGDISLTNKLWEQVYRLIYKLCNKYYCFHEEQAIKAGVELDDLTQESYFVMLDAIRSFDKSKEYKFTAYINFAMKNQFNTIIGYRTAGGRNNVLNNAISLDKPINNDEENLTLASTIPSLEDDFEKIIDNMANKQCIKIIFDELEKIGGRHSEVIYKRYFLGQTLKSIGDQHGIAKESVRRIEKAALRKIRRIKAIQEVSEIYANRNTNYYRHKGVTSFNNTRSSVVEDTAEQRERFREEFREKYNL